MSKPRSARSLAFCLILGSLCACAAQAAPPADKHKAEKGALDVDARISGTITAGISIGDARRLATQNGLTGGKPLPPGIRKNLARGKPLPPGIQKTRMPDAFVSQLPHHPGHEWRQAGADLVLVASGSLVISDILEGVFD
ncbi:MAG TPA: anti-virulence regulator CigR family protein [Xanthomonadales bacterium]|nr:anti-virulence regulator CigR family protein [Xanthomonadales bacterium]